tara:strand:+ start:2670 stop:2930 length:261 start_codon:yes stop_codon:yes gene_type:complete
MDINQLINIIKKKISDSINIESIIVEDKTFLHKKHDSFRKDKFHIRIKIESEELRYKKKIEATKIVHSIINEEIKNYIHSIQIFFK